jgi:hypothetical protein
MEVLLVSAAIIFGHESLVAGLANIVFFSQMGLNVVYESMVSVINRRENRKYNEFFRPAFVVRRAPQLTIGHKCFGSRLILAFEASLVAGLPMVCVTNLASEKSPWRFFSCLMQSYLVTKALSQVLQI